MNKILLIVVFCISGLAQAAPEHFFLIGSPGSGKGTFTQFLQIQNYYTHLCLGDLLRAEINNNTALGKEIKHFVEGGQLVPNEVVFALFEEKLAIALKNGEKIIVDGMLQSEEHVHFFDYIMSKYKLHDNFNFVYLSISKNIARERLLSRLVCNHCNTVTRSSIVSNGKCVKCVKCNKLITKRMDDQLKTVDVRLDRYFTKILPLVKYYSSRNGFKEYDSSKEYNEMIIEYKKNYLK